MFALIKFPFKLLSLPLMAVFSIMAFLVKILSNLSGYVLSPLILFCGKSAMEPRFSPWYY